MVRGISYPEDLIKILNEQSLSLIEKEFCFINEAKTVNDFRHEPAFKELPFWPKKEDPQYIHPSEGFHFIYHKGVLNLASTSNDFYSAVVALGLSSEVVNGEIPTSLMRKVSAAGGNAIWNHFGGVVNFSTKTLTVNKESAGGKTRQRTLNDTKEIQSALKNLKSYGLKEDFKIKGVPSPHNGLTVGEFLLLKDDTDEIINDGTGKVMYHGTSKKRWDSSISKKGLRPGNTGEAYNDLVKGYSEFNVYLGTTQKTAEFYGKRQAKKDSDDQYVVLQVRVPDGARIMADDAFFYGSQSSGVKIKNSVRELGSVAYKGIIPPSFIKLLSVKKA